VRPDQLERQLRARLNASGPARRAELLHVLMLPDFERADRIGEFWSYPQSRTFAAEPLRVPTGLIRCVRTRYLVLAFGVLVSAGCAAPSGGSTPTTSSSAVHAAGGAESGFTPSTYVEGDSVVMPVTFPDGTAAELVYPPELHLSDLRVQPYSSGYGPDFARDFLVFDKPLDEVIGSYEEAELLTEYEDGHGGTVGFWRLPPDGLYLAFQFGSWTVLVYDYAEEGAQMTDEDRALWATNLHGGDAEDGFLLLEADPPLRLARAGEHAGPELGLWSRNGDARALSLYAGDCRPYGDELVDDLVVDRESDDFAAWCLPDTPMEVHVTQDAGDTFIDDVLRGLEVRDVTSPHGARGS
jgi:hypothetical protein